MVGSRLRQVKGKCKAITTQQLQIITKVLEGIVPCWYRMNVGGQ